MTTIEFKKIVLSFYEEYLWLNNLKPEQILWTDHISNKPEHTVSTVKLKHNMQGIPEYFFY